MPNDAKLGLVVGVGVVIAVAFVFFRKEAGASVPMPNGSTAAAVNSPKDPAADAARGSGQPVKAKSSGQALGTISQTIPTVRRHTVQTGDSLIGLAEKYYGDRDKSELILQANREVLQNADDLTPGTRLVIPHVAARGQELLFPSEETGR
jgi:nucleoid-associated protein YgaU